MGAAGSNDHRYPVILDWQGKNAGIDVCEYQNIRLCAANARTFGPDKADVIYDCAGNNITMGQAN